MSKHSPPLKKSTGSNPLKIAGMGCFVMGGLLLVALIVLSLGVIPGLPNPLGNSQGALSGLADETSPELMLAHREKEETQLNSYGWVDEQADIVRIPINQAMALVAERGLPVGSVEVEEPPAPTPTQEVDSEAPAEGTPVAEEVPATPAAEGGSETPAEETPVAEESPATPAPDSVEEPATEEAPPAEPTVNLAEVSFQAHVLPIFEQSCIQCHGGERTEEGLILNTHEDIMAGSWNGSVIEPGDVESSYLIEQVVTGRMPKDGPRLTPAEVEIITAWVEAGAPDN